MTFSNIFHATLTGLFYPLGLITSLISGKFKKNIPRLSLTIMTLLLMPLFTIPLAYFVSWFIIKDTFFPLQMGFYLVTPANIISINWIYQFSEGYSDKIEMHH